MNPRNLALAIAQLSTSLFSGGMFFIALGIVPYWNSLPPQEFKTWFATNGIFLGRVMIPLGITSILSCIAAWLYSGRPHNRRMLGTSLACLGVTFLLYIFIYSDLNSFLLEAANSPQLTIEEARTKWTRWHWVRTVLGIVATFTAMRVRAGKTY